MKQLLHYLIGGVLLTSIAPLNASEILGDDLRVSGFASGAYSYSDNETPYYANRDIIDNCWDCETILGLQLDYQISDNWRLSAQGVKRPQDEWDSPALEWIYVGWQATDSLEARVGRLRLPVFLMSSYYYVTQAYPWIRPPSEVYNSTLGITQYDGGEFRWTFNVNDFNSITIQPFYGTERTESVDLGVQVLDIDVDYTYGLAVNMESDNYRVNFATLKSKFKVDPNPQSVDMKLYTLGFIYNFENVDIWSEIESDDTSWTWYTAVNYRLDAWSLYAIYGESNAHSDAAFVPSTSDTSTIGARYDFPRNISLNLQYDYTQAKDMTSGQFVYHPGFLGEKTDANVVSLGLSATF